MSSVFFFFKQKTAYEMRISDWSSDVCSSDLAQRLRRALRDRLPGLLTDHLQCLACQARGAGFQAMHSLVKRIGTGLDPLHRLRAPGIELVGDGRQLEPRLLERSEGRRVGQEGVSRCRSWMSPVH